eukprot:Skav236083  [mRNA]  locus=scaffold2211:423592:432683:- [translate_table: standard]
MPCNRRGDHRTAKVRARPAPCPIQRRKSKREEKTCGLLSGDNITVTHAIELLRLMHSFAPSLNLESSNWVSSKLDRKLRYQLEDPFSVISGTLPTWAVTLPKSQPKPSADSLQLMLALVGLQEHFQGLLQAVAYTQVSAGGEHTVLLRSDGSAVACGGNHFGQCGIPLADDRVTITQVSAGGFHTVLLRSDGFAVACGRNDFGQCDIPTLDDGVTYTQVSAGRTHTVLLRSDGSAVACGDNTSCRCDIPPVDDGVPYTQISSSSDHTVLLRSDGSAVACGNNYSGQCGIPLVDDRVTITQVSAGGFHTVLLRSDGSAVACGRNDFGQCDIPTLDDGVTYTQVSAGRTHTVLLRSDGSAVACGNNCSGQCKIPSLLSWMQMLWFGVERVRRRYIASFKVAAGRPERILQVDFLHEGDALILRCFGMDGEEVVRLRTRGSDLAVDALKQLIHKQKTCREQQRLVLPNGQLLDAVCLADPLITLADLHLEHDKL